MPDECLYNEKELMKLISEGDEFAFAKLFAHYRDRVFSIAFKLTKLNITAEEIVQDVFLKIWLKRANLNEIQNLSSYIFIVTRNEAYRVLKLISRNYKMILLTDEDQSFTTNNAADLIASKEYSLILQKAISRLPNQQRQVYYLIKDRGLKRDDVAYQLNIKPETVKFHLAQAMKNIRAYCMVYIGVLIGFIMFLSCLFRNK